MSFLCCIAQVHVAGKTEMLHVWCQCFSEKVQDLTQRLVSSD